MHRPVFLRGKQTLLPFTHRNLGPVHTPTHPDWWWKFFIFHHVFDCSFGHAQTRAQGGFIKCRSDSFSFHCLHFLVGEKSIGKLKLHGKKE